MKVKVGTIASAAIVAAVVLAGCSSGSPSSQGTSTSSTSTGIAGAPTKNSLQMTLNETEHTVSVACIRDGSAINASGVTKGYSANVTVQGANDSRAVVVQTASSGQRTIEQAINGLRDSAGKTVGKLTVTTNGDHYSGHGIFVLTVLDPTGKAVTSSAAQTATGSFALDCSNGYASPPKAPSTSSTTTTTGSSTSTT